MSGMKILTLGYAPQIKHLKCPGKSTQILAAKYRQQGGCSGIKIEWSEQLSDKSLIL
jgi:hypothetical protein